MRLDVGEHSRLIPVAFQHLPYGRLDILLQLFGSGSSFVSEPIEVDQGCHIVDLRGAIPVRHVLGELVDGDISSCFFAAPFPDERRPRVDALALQVHREHFLDEILLGPTLHDYGEGDHGLSPNRFFCQSSPVVRFVVYSSSSQCL